MNRKYVKFATGNDIVMHRVLKWPVDFSGAEWIAAIIKKYGG